jgi:hypothetical protein
MKRQYWLFVAALGTAACSGERTTGISPMLVPGETSQATAAQRAYAHSVATLEQRLAMLELLLKAERQPTQRTRDDIAETRADLASARAWLAEASAASGGANFDVEYGPADSAWDSPDGPSAGYIRGETRISVTQGTLYAKTSVIIVPAMLSMSVNGQVVVGNSTYPISIPYNPAGIIPMWRIDNTWQLPGNADCHRTAVNATATTTHSAGWQVKGVGLEPFSILTSDGSQCEHVPTKLVVTLNASRIRVNEGTRATVTAYSSDGQPFDCPNVQWSTTNDNFAIVSSNGYVTAMSPISGVGIEAICGGVRATAYLFIDPPPDADPYSNTPADGTCGTSCPPPPSSSGGESSIGILSSVLSWERPQNLPTFQCEMWDMYSSFDGGNTWRYDGRTVGTCQQVD